jgi:4-hydroxybenzoate polyprenyltransferase
MLRIKDWIKSYFWIPLIGAFLVQPSLRSFLLVSIVFFCVTAYSFVVNNYFDAELDKTHKGKITSNTNPLSQKLVSERGVLTLLGILLFIPSILAIQINFIGFIFVLLSVLASTFYSMKYVKIKERIGLDLITHGFMFGFFPFLAGVTLSGGILCSYFIFIAILFTIITSNQLLIHQITDYKQDLGHTKNTTIFLGLKTAHTILLFSTILGLLICLGIAANFINDVFCALVCSSVLSHTPKIFI